MKKLYYTYEPPADVEYHPYYNRWRFGACDALSVDENGSSCVRNIPDQRYPILRGELDHTLEIIQCTRESFELHADNHSMDWLYKKN